MATSSKVLLTKGGFQPVLNKPEMESNLRKPALKYTETHDKSLCKAVDSAMDIVNGPSKYKVNITTTHEPIPHSSILNVGELNMAP
jgi:hypothetical protein